jgi:hypothetical protein
MSCPILNYQNAVIVGRPNGVTNVDPSEFGQIVLSGSGVIVNLITTNVTAELQIGVFNTSGCVGPAIQCAVGINGSTAPLQVMPGKPIGLLWVSGTYGFKTI